MSADNTIVILQTPIQEGVNDFEYRIIHAQAIENIYWNEKLGKEIRDDADPDSLIDYFGEATPFFTRDNALKFANKLHDRIGYVEYGISFIELQHPFSYYLKNCRKKH